LLDNLPSSFFLSFCHFIMASPVASAALKARVRNPALLKKLARPEDLMHHFPNGSYIGWSGFTAVGYPK
jgi:acetyl-CoA hydrolase